MVLHFWLIPAILIWFFLLWVFYILIKRSGGSGTRSEGRTVLDKSVQEEDPPA